jgi:biotin carboxyl carrier protein
MTSNDHTNTTGRSGNPEPGLKILDIQGDLYHTRLTKKFEKRTPWKKPDEKQVMSFIPGTILNIFVKPGDAVETGGKLLVLEAMKMQNIIISPVTGRIKSIHIKAGEKIKKGVLMMEFE